MFNVLLLKVFSLFTMILDYRDDKLVYIMAGEQKELFTLTGQCLINLSK